MDNIKSNIKGVVGSNPYGVLIEKIEKDYFEVTHSRLNYKSFGYSTIRSFLEDMPDVVRIIEKNGQSLVTMVISQNAPKSLKNLAGIITKSVNTKDCLDDKKEWKEKRNNRNNHSSKKFTVFSPHNNLILYGHGKVVNQQNGENCKIALLNGIIEGEDNSLRLDYDGTIMDNIDTSFTNGSWESSVYGLNMSHRNDLVSQRPVSVTSLMDIKATSPENNLIRQPLMNGKTTSHNDVTERCNVYKSRADESDDWGCWFVKPIINFDALHKEVIVLGVQSGQALVATVNTKLNNDLLLSKNITIVFPGDIVLWQPPFNGSQMPECYVNINSVFPATVIKRCNPNKIEIRILFLKSFLEVSMSDIFEMPSSSSDLLRIVNTVKSREMTMLVLAAIPTNINIWEENVLAGVYTVVFSVDEEGSILERYDQRNRFLNLMLLSHIEDNLVVKSNITEKHLFMRHFMYLLDRSKSAISPTYEKLMSKNDMYMDGYPLSLIYDVDECKDKMLIGSKSLLTKDLSMSYSHQAGSDNFTLLRLKYSGNMSSFYSLDDQSADIVIPSQIPLVGIYVINESFILSTASNNSLLRFKTALLSRMPSVVNLTFKLKL